MSETVNDIQLTKADHDTADRLQRDRAGRMFAAREHVRDGSVSLISRVPHASDTLLRKISIGTVFAPGDHRAHRNRDNMLDNFEKSEKLAFLSAPETGRSMGHAAIAGILTNSAFACVLPTVLSVNEVREYALASDVPLTNDESRALDDLWSCNFDHTDRYVMPLKASL